LISMSIVNASRPINQAYICLDSGPTLDLLNGVQFCVLSVLCFFSVRTMTGYTILVVFFLTTYYRLV